MATTEEWAEYWRRYAEGERPTPPEGETEYIKDVTPGYGQTYDEWYAEYTAPKTPVVSTTPRSKSVSEFIRSLT